MSRIYLDNHASTEIDPRVADAMAEAGFGNPHSDHAVGWEAAAKIAAARDSVATLIGANQDEIIFTSGATEANNLAILGMRKKASEGRTKIIRSAIEHKSVIAACDYLYTEWGFDITVLPVSNEGMIDLNALEVALDDRTALCTVGFVNNEIGTIQNIQSIGRLCRDAGVSLHTDAVQAPLAADLADLALWCDLISLSSHKMHGPMGVGALFIAGNLQHAIAPIMFGGSIEADELIALLQPQLAASSGSACTAGTIEPSYVLTALGLPTDQVRSAVRFGFARKMDPTQIQEAALLVSEAAERCAP
ncbi:UNVERIFIED_CONTAM: hypothetical protein GTU68_041994 [Idotea baltica]|nr:hypothetical protein [Idotea baltica]